MPRPGPRRPLVALRLSNDEIAGIDAIAAEDGVSRSEAIRRLLSAHPRMQGTDSTSQHALALDLLSKLIDAHYEVVQAMYDSDIVPANDPAKLDWDALAEAASDLLEPPGANAP
jgi:hypothetical protein